ncbi:MAG: nitroreductase family protein [Oscillospiraceae bacterium]|nr:nitroreductase family protein [Oscillospiraceae bacterium]
MQLQAVLESRRSIRAYEAGRQVTREQVEEIVAAASQAPSWKNSQTARYYCVLSPEMVEKFSQACLPPFNAQRAQNAALVVTTFVANRSGFSRDGTPDNELGNGWGIYDLGLQSENFLLKAKELGLGTLIMGIRDADKIRAMLDIPEQETIVSVIALGYAAESPERPPRKTPEQILRFY